MIKVEIPNKYLDDCDYLNDSNYFFNIKPGDYSLDFELCEYIIDNNNTDGYDILITGHLKWDGCMNWSTSSDCMYHFCGSDDAFKLAKMFKFLEDLGKEHITNWLD